MIRINNMVRFCLLALVYQWEVISVDTLFRSDFVKIKLDSGILQGNIKSLDDGQVYYNFQGIPFALPPIGNLRFKNPVPYKKWSGTLNATAPGPSCIEIIQRQVSYFVEGEENCLFLNVYSKQNPHFVKTLLPVMVWIHGGAFREGNQDLYGPEYLMKENIVVVTFNYRLGVFGFLSTQDSNAPGNYGLKDTLMVLKWVRANINKFGGNPERVTVFGESAGAAIVGYLMLSNQAKNLFHAAIMQSGTPLCTWALHRNPKKVAFDLGISLGITTNNSATLIKYLRSVDLPNAHQSMIEVNLLNFVEAFSNGGPFGPVLEPQSQNAFLTKDSYKALRNGDFHKVPVIIGVNSQEGKFFNSLIPFIRPLFFFYDISPSSLVRPTMNITSTKDQRAVGTEIKQFYFKSGNFVSATNEELVEFSSDDQFVRPVTRTAQFMSRYVPVYFYVLDYEGDIGNMWLRFKAEESNLKGTAHAADLWYLFNATWAQQGLKTENERLTSRRLVRLWTNFATFKNPTPKLDSLLENITWPSIKSSEDIGYLHIGENLEIRRNFKKRNVQFWNHIYSYYSKGPYETY